MFATSSDALFFAIKNKQHNVALKIQRMFYNLRRDQKIKPDHMSVLQHYSKKGVVPNPAHAPEAKAVQLWAEMTSALEPLLRKEGYLQ